MRLGTWLRPPRHLLVLFAGLTLISTAALGWSSWQLVQQDRDLAAQRAQEQRDSAAGRAADHLRRMIGSLESQLAAVASALPSARPERSRQLGLALPNDAVFIVMAPDDVTAYPAHRLLFYPAILSAEHVSESHVDAADVAEFQQRDYDKAATMLRATPASAPAAVRAEAWLRLARNLKKSQRWQKALDVYGQLAELGDVPVGSVGGVPAGLVARIALCELLAERGMHDRLAHEAGVAVDGLRTGRWRLTRAAYDDATTRVRRWTDGAHLPEAAAASLDRSVTSAATILSEAAHQLWSERQHGTASRSTSTRVVGDGSVLVIEYEAPDVTLAVLAQPAALVSDVVEPRSAIVGENARIALADADGRSVAGGPIPTRDFAVRVGATTGLPWTIYATTRGEPAPGRFTSRIVVAGLSAIVLLVSGGSYLIGRAVMRELRVARLQSDFVSAVSHEFRTPLTAITQMSDLLASDRVTTEARRHQYYGVLQVESGRLHRLIEGLLRFGRMEAGALPMRFESVHAFDFVDEVVGDFSREAARHGYRVKIERTGPSCLLRMDRESLTCAVWNLLDNALKYSPEHRTIWVSVGCIGERVAIAVRDHGVGVADADRARIFDKFTRGDIATTLGVRGTGIGLAVARQIVSWHGGTIAVEGAPGGGSVFTITLPVTEENVT